jgi:Holliday junction resolvase RusA-like endonuclease
MIEIKVIGRPAPQGSKNQGANGQLYESSKYVMPWREAVIWAAREAMRGRERLTGPVFGRFVYTLHRPASRPAHRFPYPDRYPDLSKLQRATEDALTSAGVWEDDSRLVTVTDWRKVYVSSDLMALDVPGALIWLWSPT